MLRHCTSKELQILQYFDMKYNFTKSKSLQIVIYRSSVHFSLQKNMIFIIKAKRNRQNLYIKWIIWIFVAYPFDILDALVSSFLTVLFFTWKCDFRPFTSSQFVVHILCMNKGKRIIICTIVWWAINKKIQPQRSCLA